MTSKEAEFDYARPERIGLEEAVFCAGKSAEQIAGILDEVGSRGVGVLLTRLNAEKAHRLPEHLRAGMDYCQVSMTGFFGPLRPVRSTGCIAIVAAGTSDVPVAREALRTLRHAGVEANSFTDVGVAGLWRLMKRIDEIRAHPVVIAVAGMDAALASVLGGMIPGVLIGVPTSVGYGAAEDGRTALNAMLASCAPGVTVCNIDNGYGAAAAALRVLRCLRPETQVHDK